MHGRYVRNSDLCLYTTWTNFRRNGQKVKFPPIEVPEKISLALSVGFNASGEEHTGLYYYGSQHSGRFLTNYRNLPGTRFLFSAFYRIFRYHLWLARVSWRVPNLLQALYARSWRPGSFCAAFTKSFHLEFRFFTFITDYQWWKLGSAGLTPIIEFQNVEREMLGYPYSICVPTNSSE